MRFARDGWRIVGVVALMLTLGACTASNAAPSHQRTPSRHEASTTIGSQAAPRGEAYWVVAPVLKARGAKAPMACEVMLLSLPPAGCGGVTVTGYDFERLPGVTHAGGAWWTGPLLLVGTWDGQTLTLTKPPSPRARPQPEPSQPAYCRGYATRSIAAIARRITRQHSRLHVLTLQPCHGKVWVLVAVADKPTVRYIRDRFGNQVVLRGWLRPS